MKFSTILVAASAASCSTALPLGSSESWYSWAIEKAQQITFGLPYESIEEVQPTPETAGPWPPITKPLVSSEALQALINEPALHIQVGKLYKAALIGAGMYGHPTRVIGSAGHFMTLSNIEKTLYSLGPYYNVTKQYFNATRGVIFKSSLSVEDVIITATPFDLTPPTPKKKPVTAPLVLVSNNGCNTSDFPASANGSIVLIERGVCAFGDKSENAGLAGAVAAIIYNNVPGEATFGGTLGTPLPEQVATLGVTYEVGSEWASQLAQNISLNATAMVDSFVKNVTTYNIIADTRTGDENNVVMLGAHSDSVTAGPGINDDGSGTISLLEVATALSKFSVTNKVRFAWWAAEEEGLIGSDYYVSQLLPEENAKIRLFMDYDMMASPNYAFQVYDANNSANPEGSEELKQLYIDYYTSQGVNHTLIPFDGRSDYDAFIKNGIPGGGVAAGAEVLKTPEEVEMFGGVAGVPYDKCYHQLCDDPFNLNYYAFMMNTKLIAHAVGTYAASLDGFPVRKPVTPVSAAASSVAPKRAQEYKFHGPKVVL